MKRNAEALIGAPVREAIVRLVGRDRDTHGSPGLGGDREALREWLAQLLVDSEKLIGHMEFLKGQRGGEARPRPAVRTRGPAAPPGVEALAGEANRDLLPEEKSLAIADRGLGELEDGEAARLLLNPFALCSLAELINTLLPEEWQPRLAAVGKEVMERHGLKVPERHEDQRPPTSD
jgi:hypothetical protein